MGDTRCHLADGGKPLPKPGVTVEFLDVGDVLKYEQQAGIPTGGSKRGRGEPDVDIPPVGRAVGGVEAAAQRRL